MILRSTMAAAACALASLALPAWAQAPVVTQLTSPDQFSASRAVINFDFSPVATATNSLCRPTLGIQFSNVGTAPVPIYEWTDLVPPRVTTSAPHVLATVSSHGGTFSPFLNVDFDSPKTELGAYFGNDQGAGAIGTVQLSVFSGETLLGSVSVAANGNTSVDQFIGLRSTVPFTSARFDNLPPSIFSVVLDDVMFNMDPGTPGTISTVGTPSPDDPLIPFAVAVREGTVYVADQAKHTVWRLNSDGSKTAIAGTGEAGFNGDGIEAVIAQLHNPTGVAVDLSGAVYIADSGNHAIRKVATPGVAGAVITTVAGVAGPDNFAVGSPNLLYGPRAVAIGPGGYVYIADRMNQQIRRVAPGGTTIETVAGVAGLTGATDGPASCTGTGCIPARFNSPVGVAVDSTGNVYVADEGNNRVRVVTTAGQVRTLTGGARAPSGVALSGDGSTLYVADLGNHLIRRIPTAGDCGFTVPIAGTGAPGFSTDAASPATSAPLNSPIGVAVDGGAVYVADKQNGRVRRVVFPIIF
jgi:sugar lactone lactonase YvrE